MTNLYFFAIIIDALGSVIFSFPLASRTMDLLGLISQIAIFLFSFLLSRVHMCRDARPWITGSPAETYATLPPQN